MKKIILIFILFFIFTDKSFATCQDAATGNWSSGSTWSGCTGSGGVPGSSDTVDITSHTITLDTSPSIVAILISGSTAAKLIVDGASPHTITCSTSSSDCIDVEQGATPVFDTSAGSATNLLTIAAPNLTSSYYGIGYRWEYPYANVTMKIEYVVATSLGSAAYGFANQSGGSNVITFKYCDIENVPTAIYSGSTLTVQFCKFNAISGTPTIDLDYVTTATITDNTEIGVVANGYMINTTSTPPIGWTIERNAIVTDSSGTYHRPVLFFNNQAQTGTSPTLIEYNIAKSYNATNSSSDRGISGCKGISAAHCTIAYNVIDGYYQDISLQSYDDTSYNVLIDNQNGAQGQGSIDNLGASNDTSSSDMYALDSSAGNFNLFEIGSGGAASNISADHETIIGILPGNGNDADIQFGEGSGSNLSVTSGQISNNIVSTMAYGILSGNSSNSFVTSGTGSVGVFNNDVYNTTHPYTSAGTNFGSGHPSATYGDVTINPNIVSSTTRFQNCDTMFGGPGTVADLFTELSNRWNSTNDPRFTPQNIWICMSQAFTPLNLSLLTVSSSGSYIGAIQPAMLNSTGVQ
jgi:hypothetical protein